MKKYLTEYKSDKFNVESTASLSLFLYPRSTYLFARDQNQSILAILGFSQSIEKLSELIQAEELLALSVPISVFTHDPNFALVPGGLFVKGEEATYLQYAAEQKKPAHYFSTGIEGNKIQLLGAIDHETHALLSGTFPQVTFHHGACSFLSYLFYSRANLLGQEILIQLLDDKMYIACFTDQELASFGMFDLLSQEDLIKYPRALMAQHEYNPAHARVTVLGSSKSIETDEEWGKNYFHQYVSASPKSNQTLALGLEPAADFGMLEAFWQFD